MSETTLATLFYREIQKITSNEELKTSHKIEALHRLLSIIFVETTKAERLQFSTLFTRIAYVSHKYQFPKKLQFFIHRFRKIVSGRNGKEQLSEVEILPFGIKVLSEIIIGIFEENPPKEVLDLISDQWPDIFQQADIQSFKKQVRVVVLAEDKKNDYLLGRNEDLPGDLIQIQYNLPERNENFNPSIKSLQAFFEFPYLLNLIDVEINKDGIYQPRAFVIEPDFLVDVSAISECFSAGQNNPWLYLLKKYLPFDATTHLMIGNIANFFLDELMNDATTSFPILKKKLFALNPLGFCLFSDRQVKEIIQATQKHYLTLKKMVVSGFQEQNILPEHAHLEPSFFSEKYGLQGRLDIFYHNPDEKKKAAIVELKSGKSFMPNIYGISPNHFMQTLLYDLIVHDVFGKGIDPTNYILYSGQETNQLRFAPASKTHQFDGLQIRNLIVSIEKIISSLGNSKLPLLKQGRQLFNRLRAAKFPTLKGFAKKDMAFFERTFDAMSELEQKYFIAFSGFIAREHLLAKTGIQGFDRLNGLAALWRDGQNEKIEAYTLLNALKLTNNAANEEEALLSFAKTENTNPLANFRKGDIAILYPQQENQSPLSTQLFKCTIIELDTQKVVLRLRAKQFNADFFEEFPFWNIEHDVLDSSFTGMYRNLFAFAESSTEKKQLLLAQRPPEIIPESEITDTASDPKMTEEQNRIFKKILTAKDYFLLWGPPGTGKTSVMLRKIVEHLFFNTKENILLLAYTNRAVDEICEAINSITENMVEHYFRIGSRYSTDTKWQKQLLNLRIEDIHSRKGLKDFIDKHRIVVGTVSSVVGKTELFKLKSFDQVIIDEASQIPEPMLAGMLPQFKRFILIGDHRQLPAVVAQNERQSAVADEDLQAIGLNDLRNSLFERLYLKCIKNDWHHAYAQLSHQGRMHDTIMDFPSRFFYNQQLKTLPEVFDPLKRQTAPLSDFPKPKDELEKLLFENRILFISTAADDSISNNKTNKHEAELSAKIAHIFEGILHKNGTLSSKSIGIITPFRAQIAHIKQELQKRKVTEKLISVDTVERYQGGARNIIIISLCINELKQLNSLVSLSDEGIDRKLNVAMTRAREHLIILGNEKILNHSPLYKKLIQHLKTNSKT